MITIELPTSLAPYSRSSNLVVLEESCGTVRDALAVLASRSPGVVDRVIDERGEVRQHVNIFVDDSSIRFLQGLETAVPDGSKLFIVAAVSGG